MSTKAKNAKKILNKTKNRQKKLRVTWSVTWRAGKLLGGLFIAPYCYYITLFSIFKNNGCVFISLAFNLFLSSSNNKLNNDYNKNDDNWRRVMNFDVNLMNHVCNNFHFIKTKSNTKQYKHEYYYSGINPVEFRGSNSICYSLAIQSTKGARKNHLCDEMNSNNNANTTKKTTKQQKNNKTTKKQQKQQQKKQQ